MSAISEAEAAVLDFAAQEPMLAHVGQWAAINSGSRNLKGLAELGAKLADAFAVLPGDLRIVNPEPVETVLPDGRICETAHGSHLHLTVRADAPVQLLLTGHMDTVFGADHKFQNLQWLEDGILNGPGVADMKGGLALMLSALKAVEASPAAAGIGYEVVINSDEELGSPSSSALIRQAARGKIAALTYEPALPDGTLAGARAGSGNFSVVITGRSAHAGRNPQEGRNAIVAAADLAVRLKRTSGHGFSCNPAKIDGGGANNVVPDHAILRVNLRPASHRDENDAKAALYECAAAVGREHGVSVDIHGGFNRPPKPMDDKAARLFGLVKRCGTDLGLDIEWRDTGGVCDGNNIAACGVPVVDTMGARGGSIHSDEEFLIIESLAERARLSVLTILRLAERGRI